MSRLGTGLRVLAQPSGRLLANLLVGVALVALMHLAVQPRGLLRVLVVPISPLCVQLAEKAARVLRPERGRPAKHGGPATYAALDALSVRRPFEPRKALGEVLFQPSTPIAVRVAQLTHRFSVAALGLRPNGHHLRLLRHRLLPRIRLGAADGAALHEALERRHLYHQRLDAGVLVWDMRRPLTLPSCCKHRLQCAVADAVGDLFSGGRAHHKPTCSRRIPHRDAASEPRTVTSKEAPHGDQPARRTWRQCHREYGRSPVLEWVGLTAGETRQPA
eukprot:scaffold12020_cov57-Phaeocystis_antarctica.AAC.2